MRVGAEELSTSRVDLLQQVETLQDENARLRAEIERLRAAAGGEQGGEGFVLVPREPTDEMVWAGGTALHDQQEDSASIYRAMIAAAGVSV